MSTERAADLPCNIPFRARLARFDRPAQSLIELLQAEGGDFVHLASWTLLGRRANRTEHAECLAMLSTSPHDSKGVLIADLAARAEASGMTPELAGLAHYLRVRARRSTPIVGPLLAMATSLYLHLPILGWPARFVRRIPGKFRWTYRHSRKALLKFAGWANLPQPAGVRRALGVERAPAPEGMDPRVTEYYRLLCVTVDGKEHVN